MRTLLTVALSTPVLALAEAVDVDSFVRAESDDMIRADMAGAGLPGDSAQATGAGRASWLCGRIQPGDLLAPHQAHIGNCGYGNRIELLDGLRIINPARE